jgi:hypothetical protein
MTLTLHTPHTQLSSHVCDDIHVVELRFLGTVPETDVLEVANKRNMRSKFR